MSVKVMAEQGLPSRVQRAYRAFCGRWDRDDPLLFGIKVRPRADGIVVRRD